MFRSEKMVLIHVVFSFRDAERIADTVVRHGSIQIIDSAEMEDWAQQLEKGRLEDEPIEMKARREKVEGLLRILNLPEYEHGTVPHEDPFRSLDGRITDVERTVDAELKSRESVEKELDRLAELRTRVEEVASHVFPLKQREEYSYLAVEMGYVAEKNMSILEKNLESFLHVLAPLGSIDGKMKIAAIVLRRDRETLMSALNEAGFQPASKEEAGEIPSPEVMKKVDQEIDALHDKMSNLEIRIRKIALEQGAFLHSVLLRIRREILIQKILNNFRKTERTYLLTGWIPLNKKQGFIQAVRKTTQNRCIVEETPAEDIPDVYSGKVQVPVQLKNPVFLKPFEILTKTYGIPAYRTIDPTPLLGLSILCMFGVMFGDLGHGLVLGILGSLFVWRGKKVALRHSGLLLVYAGCASMIFGVLFGSVFGMEDIVPALWLRPMESISQLFTTALYFRIGMITLAIGVNMINGILRRDFLGMIFDKAGLLAVVLYWCGIVFTTRIITTQAEAKGEIPLLVPILLIVSTVLLFLREPIIHLLQGKRRLFPQGVATGIMGGIVELLEIVLGFLANTVSFIRVAAFGLAHVGLFMAIFALSDAVQGMAGGFVSILVLIFGNILIIALEGLVVSIQAVRLEFYEFFSRFFQQSNAAYKPVESNIQG
jgi:V/A-type H+-transporting ATPase subunit I